MNKISKIFKDINKLGLAAILVAGVMTFSFKAAEKKTTDIEYGKHVVGLNVNWIPLDDLDRKSSGSPLNPGEYTCDLSIDNCSAFFPDTVTPDSSTPDPSNGDAGTFRYNP